jgi:hypothetical protein
MTLDLQIEAVFAALRALGADDEVAYLRNVHPQNTYDLLADACEQVREYGCTLAYLMSKEGGAR